MKSGKAMTFTLIGLCVLCAAVWMHGSREHRLSLQTGRSITTNQITREQAMALVSTIHTNMTFAEISKVLDISTNDTPRAFSHGGITYFAQVGSFAVALRFGYPDGPYSATNASNNSVLNDVSIVDN
jgi:hypothetical protein